MGRNCSSMSFNGVSALKSRAHDVAPNVIVIKTLGATNITIVAIVTIIVFWWAGLPLLSGHGYVIICNIYVYVIYGSSYRLHDVNKILLTYLLYSKESTGCDYLPCPKSDYTMFDKRPTDENYMFHCPYSTLYDTYQKVKNVGPW